jgi:hypothetical protein
MTKIKCWYGSCGALVTESKIDGNTNAKPFGDFEAAVYGGRWIIGESMQKSTAVLLASAMGLEFVEKDEKK